MHVGRLYDAIEEIEDVSCEEIWISFEPKEIKP